MKSEYTLEQHRYERSTPRAVSRAAWNSYHPDANATHRSCDEATILQAASRQSPRGTNIEMDNVAECKPGAKRRAIELGKKLTCWVSRICRRKTRTRDTQNIEPSTGTLPSWPFQCERLQCELCESPRPRGLKKKRYQCKDCTKKHQDWSNVVRF